MDGYSADDEDGESARAEAAWQEKMRVARLEVLAHADDLVRMQAQPAGQSPRAGAPAQRLRTIRRVFLAGKITDADWRRSIMRGDLELAPAQGFRCLIGQVCGGAPVMFPIGERAVLSMLDYVGPYHIGTDDLACGCDAKYHSHGAWHYQVKQAIMQANQRAVRAADIVFAWIDDASAIGTAYELGYAQAQGKEVWIAGPRYVEGFGLLYDNAFCDIADPACGDDESGVDTDARSAFLRLLCKRLGNPWRGGDWAPLTVDPALFSPIEEAFLRAWNEAQPWRREDWSSHPAPRYIGLVPQWPVDGGRYRLDFAVPDYKIGIELDGLVAHSSTEQIAHDRRRQREIEAMGWKIIRFGGKEVHRDAADCVSEARHVIVSEIERAQKDAQSLRQEADRLLLALYEAAGRPFNVNAPEAVTQVLREATHMDITWQADWQAMAEHWRGRHPIVDLLLRWHQVDAGGERRRQTRGD